MDKQSFSTNKQSFSMNKAKFLLSFAVIFVTLGTLFIFQSQNSGKLKIIFCDVGQGDGMLIVTPGGKQIVVDGGPGKKILDCLSENMPYWDREVEFMVSTHPQSDHMEGLVAILNNYQVKNIATTGVENKTQLFKVWQEALGVEGAKIYTPNVGDKISVDSGVTFTVLWPPFAKASGGEPSVEEWRVHPPADLNVTGITLRLEYGDFCAYLTADMPKELLERLIDRQCQVLKVAHHGSKTGTSDAVLEKVKPKIAVIQVGKNSYGHPTPEVLAMLSARGVRVLRNDLEGEISVEVDGNSIKFKGENF